MKNISFLLTLFLLMSCGNDDFFRESPDRDNLYNIPEVAPEGLKLKSKSSLNFYNYFYHSNGFVDSISRTHAWVGGQWSEKFYYNNLNQIIAHKAYTIIQQAPQYNQIETTYYKYNNLNQIISLVTYNKDSVVVDSKTFQYNKDGSLKSDNLINQNGNIIKDGTITYEFDSNRNPMYNLYPQAYRIINKININNIVLTKYTNDDFYIHTLKYNNDGYLVEENISNAPLDSDNIIHYTYY